MRANPGALAGAIAAIAALSVAGCTDDPSRSQLYLISGNVVAYVEGRDDTGDSTAFYLVDQPTGVLVLLVQAGAAVDSVTSDAGEFRFTYRPDGNYQVLVRQMDTVAVTVHGSNVTLADTLQVSAFGDLAAYPNPFDLDVTLSTTLADGRATLRIHQPGGESIRTLFDRTFTAGAYDFTWDALDDDSGVVVPGLYVAFLEQGGVTHAQVLARCIVPTCLETRPVRRPLDVSSRP
jgi:hypothetical protein